MENGNKNNISGMGFLKGILMFSIPTFVGALISMISVPIVTRLFRPEELGILNLFIVYVNIIIQVGLIGLEQAYVRFFYEPPLNVDRKYLGGICLTGSFLTAIVILVVVFIVSERAESSFFHGNHYIVVCLAICVLSEIVSTYTRLTSRLKYDYVKFSIQKILFTFASKMSYVLVAFLLPIHFIAIITLTASYFVIAAVFLPMLWKDGFTIVKQIKKVAIWELVRYGIPLMPVGLLAVLNNFISQLMLEKYVNYEAIGIYSSALSITAVISLVQTGFNTYWAAFVWQNYQTEQSRITKIHHLITFVMIGAGLGIVLFEDVIYLLLGEHFQGSKIYFPILLIVPIAYTISETTGLGIGIKKKTYLSMIITIIIVILNILLCYIMLPKIGALGAAISSATAAIVRLLLLTVIGERYYKCVDNFKKMILSILIYCVAIGVHLVFLNQLIMRIFILLPLLFILCCIYYNEIKYLLQFVKTLNIKKFSNEE